MGILYADVVDPTPLAPIAEAQAPWPAQEEFSSFDDCVTAYCSSSALYASVANESYALVDAKNHCLFNAYTELLGMRLGVTVPPMKQYSAEAFELRGTLAINSEIALEGWIGTLWEKIKGVFSSMYGKIKEFFKRNFTRLGKAKKALENIIAVMEKTKKTLEDPRLENYSGKLLKRYAGYGTVNADNVKKSVTTVYQLTDALSAINKEALVVANKHMVDKEFFARIKNLKDKAKASDQVKGEIDENTPGALKSLVNKEARHTRRDMKADSKSLGQISKDAKSESAGMQNKLSVLEQNDAGSDEANENKGRAEFLAFMEVVKKQMSVNLGAPLISGSVIKAVNIKDNGEVEIVMEEAGEDASSITLGGKADLLLAAKGALRMILDTEKEIEAFGKVNDSINKNMMSIDSLVRDIDRIDPDAYGAYRKVVDKQVRERLTLLRQFFSIYNKVGKNILDLTMDVSESVVDYSVLSLKKFQ